MFAALPPMPLRSSKIWMLSEILFVPDQYLGHYVSTKTNKKIDLWPGYCPTHARIRPEDILRAKKEHPQAKVVVHPECRPETIALADEVLSTGGMMRFAQVNSGQRNNRWD